MEEREDARIDDSLFLEHAKRAIFTDSGTATALAPVTSVGVYEYRRPDGSTRRELRPPEEVFDPESLKTLLGIPLTLNHPGSGKLVTPETLAKLKVGSINGEPFSDGYRVYVDLQVERADAVKALREKTHTYLSCGYTCEVEEVSGTWMGVRYDAIQRDIRYNHVALCRSPRGDENLKIRLDSTGSIVEPQPEGAPMAAEENKEVAKLVGDFQARIDAKDAELKQVRTDSEAQLKTVTAERDALQAKLDEATARQDSLDKELKAEREGMAAKIQAAAGELSKLRADAKDFGVEVKEDSSPMDIRKAVILKANPEVKLDGKSDDYIVARFDSVVEAGAKSVQIDNQNKQVSTPNPANGQQRNDSQDETADAARARMIARLGKLED